MNKLTKEQEDAIRAMCLGQGGYYGYNKIALIKEYRAFTGNGLKESKDALERVCPDWSDIKNRADEVVALFNGEMEEARKAREQAEKERAAAEKKALEEKLKQEHEANKNRLLRGVALCYDNWSDLGYGSQYDAVNGLLSQFEDRGLIKS